MQCFCVTPNTSRFRGLVTEGAVDAHFSGTPCRNQPWI
jgi:hypothetical protein